MQRQLWPKYIEVSSNIAVLVVAMALLGAIVSTRWFPRSDTTKLDLDYKKSKRTDQSGNAFRYRAKVKDTNDAQLGRWAWDVFLVRAP